MASQLGRRVPPEYLNHPRDKPLQLAAAQALAHGFTQVELMATLPGVKLYAARGYVGSQMVHFEVALGESIEFIPMCKNLA